MFTNQLKARPSLWLVAITVTIIALTSTSLLSDHKSDLKPVSKPPARHTPSPNPRKTQAQAVPSDPAEQASRARTSDEFINVDKPLGGVLKAEGITPRSIEINVDKSDRALQLVVNGQVVKSYLVALGGSPDTDKSRRGDKATPEGDYYVCQRLTQSRFYLSLKVSYPNIEDARRGLKSGLIDQATYNAIARAINSRQAPPMATALGGDICIHGGGSGELDRATGTPVAKVSDWTAGCMALNNPEMKELFEFIPLGTPVHIRA